MPSKGANKPKCKAYMIAGTRTRNRLRKLRKHLATHPQDADATAALKATK